MASKENITFRNFLLLAVILLGLPRSTFETLSGFNKNHERLFIDTIADSGQKEQMESSENNRYETRELETLTESTLRDKARARRARDPWTNPTLKLIKRKSGIIRRLTLKAIKHSNKPQHRMMVNRLRRDRRLSKGNHENERRVVDEGMTSLFGLNLKRRKNPTSGDHSNKKTNSEDHKQQPISNIDVDSEKKSSDTEFKIDQASDNLFYNYKVDKYDLSREINKDSFGNLLMTSKAASSVSSLCIWRTLISTSARAMPIALSASKFS
jgi:hypothetical protein